MPVLPRSVAIDRGVLCAGRVGPRLGVPTRVLTVCWVVVFCAYRTAVVASLCASLFRMQSSPGLHSMVHICALVLFLPVTE